MILYLLLGFILLFFSFFGKKSKVIFILLLLALVLISSIRAYSVGFDTSIYLNEYTYANNLEWSDLFSTEYPLFNAYCKILGFFNFDHRMFIVATSIFNGILVYFICNKTNNPILTLSIFYLLGLYLQTFCIIRQCIAILFIALGFFSFTNGRIRNVIIYYVFNAIAIGFHFSSIVLLTLPIFYLIFGHFKSSKYKYLIIGLIFLFVTYAISISIYPYIDSFLFGKYKYEYSTYGKRSFDGNLDGGILYSILYLLLYSIYYLKFDSVNDVKNKEIGILFIIAFSFNAFSYMSEDLGRLNLFLEYLLVFKISDLLDIDYNNKYKYYYVYGIIFAAYLILYLSRNSIGVVPYMVF